MHDLMRYKGIDLMSLMVSKQTGEQKTARQ